MTDITWTIDPGAYLQEYTQYVADQIEAEIVELVDSLADEAGQWMRQNHPWQNQTGEAEAGLYADIEHAVHQSVVLLLSHGPSVMHSYWLEHAFAGRLSVLQPAADHFWPILLRGALEIVRRHSG